MPNTACRNFIRIQPARVYVTQVIRVLRIEHRVTEYFVLTLSFDCAYSVVLLICFLPVVYGKDEECGCVMNGVDTVGR